MEAQNAFITVVLVGMGIAVLVAVVWGFAMQMGGPPADAQAVIKYYDDLFKGEINGRKVNPAAVALGFFIPLLASFSILWALIGILPIFSKNPKPAMILSLGISFYFTPSMSWILISIFPTMMGVSSIMIGIAVLLASIFILASTSLWFKGIHKSSASLPPGETGYTGGWPWEGREKKEGKEDKLRKEYSNLVIRIDKFFNDCNIVINKKDKEAVPEYKQAAMTFNASIGTLINNITASKLPDYEKFEYSRALGRRSKKLKEFYDKLDELEKTPEKEKEPAAIPTSATKSREELKNRLLEKVKELEGLKGDAAKVRVIIPQKEIDELIHIAEKGSAEAIQGHLLEVEKFIEETKKRLKSSESEKETITNELKEKIKKAEDLKLDPTQIQSFKILVEKGTLEQKKHAIKDLDGWINSQKGKEKEEVPKVIPSNIVDLHSEFRRCIDGIYNYMEDLHNRTDKWKTKSTAMKELWRTSQVYLNVYKSVKEIALNAEQFYRFIVQLSSGRRSVLVGWFHFLPKSLDEIENTAKQLNSERDKIEDKEFLKLVDIILNEILCAETFKLFETLREVYHSMITEAENLKIAK